MRTAVPVVGPFQPSAEGDFLWRPFAEALPPEGAHVLVGSPDKGTYLQPLERRGPLMFVAQSRRNDIKRQVFGKAASLARTGEWWMLLPHVGPEAV
jgi:hypothetical protein